MFQPGQLHTRGYDFFCRRRAISGTSNRLLASACDVDINEGAQAVVLTEVAARILIASGAIADVRHRIDADEGRLFAVLPEPQCFLGSADRSGFSAVLMDNDLRLLALGPETGLYEIHFCFHHCQVVLRAALQHEARSQRGEIWNAG